MKIQVYGKTALSVCLSCLIATSTFAQGTFVTNLENEAWQCSKWISVSDAPIVRGRVDEDSRAADGANWFCCEMVNKKKVVKATWMTTGLGVYELYVNGELIGDEVLKPGFTHCFKTKRSFTYDVTKAFSKAKGAMNRLSVQVTPGWWADKIITPSGSNGMYGTRCAFRGVLELTYADGSAERLGSDTEHWTAGIAGPVKHAAIFDGEDYDAREKMGYELTTGMKNAEENTEFAGVILPTNGAEVYLRHDLARSPVKAYVWKGVKGEKENETGIVNIVREYHKGRNMTLRKGETLVVDFGQNCAAVPSFVFKASRGTTLTCLPAELLNDGNGAKSRGMDGPEGSVHRQNLRHGDKMMRLNYTFANNKVASFTPRNTFFGYRYVSITATDDVTIDRIVSIPVSSITKEMEIGTITTGNTLVNKLIANTLWGQRSNYLSVPTDCPQRNERLGWTADTQVFSTTGSFFANTDRFFHKWLQDLRDSQSETGGFPGVAPFGQYGSSNNEYMRVGWADAGIIVPWAIWKQFGDRSIIDESWASMQKYMNHLNETKYSHTLLANENGNYQWADWLSYEPLESCGRGIYDSNGIKKEAIDYWNFLCASYWAMDARMMADMAHACGKEDEEVKYKAMEAEAQRYIREQFLDAEGLFKTQILNTMQTPSLFLLYNNILDGEAKANVIARLRQNFTDHGNCLQTGFLGTSILMPTLTKNGMEDIAYELLFQRKNPSWLYSVDNGATTIWERWNSYMLDRGMGPSGMNSFNHYAYGCVCGWLWETAAGIASDPKEPGFKHIIMKPVPDRRLGHLKAEYHSANGIIKSEWRYIESKKETVWEWKITIPKGTTATIQLPGEAQTHTYSSGKYTFKKNVPISFSVDTSSDDGLI